jgi:hypothetical protein
LSVIGQVNPVPGVVAHVASYQWPLSQLQLSMVTTTLCSNRAPAAKLT